VRLVCIDAPYPDPQKPNGPVRAALAAALPPEMPKPADLAVLGLRPPNCFTVTRSLSILMAAAARNGAPWASDAHLTEVSVVLPTESDKLRGIGIVGSTSVFGAAG